MTAPGEVVEVALVGREEDRHGRRG
jgi:hypothetical protein